MSLCAAEFPLRRGAVEQEFDRAIVLVGGLKGKNGT
jgi:hypothetical protein